MSRTEYALAAGASGDIDRHGTLQKALERCSEAVDTYIAHGFVCQGGVSISVTQVDSHTQSRMHYNVVQAMVRNLDG